MCGSTARLSERLGRYVTSNPASPATPGAEDDHVVRARIAHGLQERGHVGDVVGVARRRVAGEAGFDVTYLRRRSERRAVRPILPLTLTLNLRWSCVQHYFNHPY